MKSKQSVFVGLSGGVDSSVAALRLINAGYNVTGVFIKVWQPDWLDCNWEAERLDAMRVAAHLDIPFFTCDAEVAYRDEVGHYFIEEYKAGRTPNPDVLCNQHVKFGAFLDFAKERGADFIATGHYAQKQSDEGLHVLVRGVDTNKDQSYFLWTLTQAQLAHILLPVGNSTKDDIRAEAEAAGLPVAQKKDSQGVCFLGQIDIPEFLAHYTDLIPGPVLNQDGATIGEHKGALVYTLGQRHGFAVSTSDASKVPHYVIDRNVAANTITVDTTPPQTNKGSMISLVNCSWSTMPAKGTALATQFRYRQTPFMSKLLSVSDELATLQLAGDTQTPAAGQSCVLYDDDHCLGGGIIA